MRLGVLFTGGKDSTFAMYLAKKYGYEIACLISIQSNNEESYMFHTPSISEVEKQAKVMNLPIILKKTKGIKEEELDDLEKAIAEAKENYKVEGIVTGAVESVYQATRIQKICDKLDLDCFNPLWQKDQFELLNELINENFKVIITGVFAYPLNEKWLGRVIDKKFIEDVKLLNEKYGINPAGEGGEFESLVLDCPLFERELTIKNSKIFGKNNSFRMEVQLQ